MPERGHTYPDRRDRDAKRTAHWRSRGCMNCTTARVNGDNELPHTENARPCAAA
jgi:hypothetical protein